MAGRRSIPVRRSRAAPPVVDAHDVPPAPPPPPDGFIDFGWAGWLTRVPDTWRLLRIQGHHRRGMAVLGDSERPRLELAWARVNRRRFDPERLGRRTILRTAGPGLRSDAKSETRLIDHPHFPTCLRFREPDRDRFFAHCPHTGRALQIVYRHGEKREDLAVAEHTLPALRDQPLDEPHRWAFFGGGLIVPPGFVYESAKLNLGDMRVTLTAPRPWQRQASLTVRRIYPAELALQRRPPGEWLDAMLRETAPSFRPPRRGTPRHRKLIFDTIDTARGPAATCDAKLLFLLRTVFRTFVWRWPARLRSWVVHDTVDDRLINIQLADAPERFDPTLRFLLAGLNWARTAD